MRILILSFSPIARDPRVLRQLRALRSSHELVVAGFATTPEADRAIPLVPIGKRRTSFAWKLLALLTLLCGLYRVHYWFQLEFPRRALRQLKASSFDLVLANDVNTLPLAFRLAAGVPVYLDAHEFSPAEFSSLIWRLSIGRFYDWICRRLLRKVNTMSTVCSGLSELYGRTYGRKADLIVFNVPPLQQQLTAPTFEMQRLHQRIRLVHHGSAEPERRLEMMVAMLDLLDHRFSLDLFLVGSESQYARSLRDHCRDTDRLHLHPPVPMVELPQVLSQFDLGVFLLPPLNPNYHHALPNKLFEFIHAGLAIAIGPSPEMAAIVRSEGVGVVAPSFDPGALAACLNALELEQIGQMRRNAWAARERYTSQAAEQAIAASVERALTASRRP
jgi:glycosyltransferase involved in cell wall biosynthesis